MIQSFADEETGRIFNRIHGRRFSSIERVAFRKLRQLWNVKQVELLNEPPGNRLEKLRGDREGKWSIRINDQWRICFMFEGGHAYEVEIVDYH